jgi:hypothetical protein
MQRLVLTRTSRSDEGTFGNIVAPDGKRFHTIELPWRENRRRISCIPASRYIAGWHTSLKFGIVPILRNVPNRDAILMHKGNYAGDVEKGYKSDYLGCIGIGLGLGSIALPNGKQQKMITSSAIACSQVFAQLRPGDFELVILEKFNVG